MVVLSRKLGERIVIRDSIVVTISRIEEGAVRLAIWAPDELAIRRD